MKLTDYIADFLEREGVRHVFGLTGGAVVHLFDSVARNASLQPIFHHHEQAAAYAAEAYAKVTNNLGVAFVTTGPGGTNALTGLCAAWLDSVPCLFISGQARVEHSSRGKNIRQLGTQELDIVSVVSPMTKYSVMIEDPGSIRYHLEKAVFLARSGRPGPVWIDIPLNFQWASINPENLPSFKPPSPEESNLSDQTLSTYIEHFLECLNRAERPLILAGYGIRLAHAESEFQSIVEKLEIPFLSSWNACDILPTSHPLYVGRPGIAGQRGANLAIQNCDLLLCIGSHLCIPQTGTLYHAFAREAKVFVVDIDAAELKQETVSVDVAVHSDARRFLSRLKSQIQNYSPKSFPGWQNRCRRYKGYNAIPKEWKDQKEFINPYVLIDRLSDEIAPDVDVVVDGGGTNVYASYQALKVRLGQRVILSSGLCSMGSGLPESIGSCFGHSNRETICLCGDGSMQLNIQELQTVKHHDLPIKIFVFNNGGYVSIRGTQDEFLEGRHSGSDALGGMSLPNFLDVAQAYGLRTHLLRSHSEMDEKIPSILKEPGPFVCEVLVSPKQEVVPRQGFMKKSDGTFAPRPLEDMYPYLDRNEFLENMVIKPIS